MATSGSASVSVTSYDTLKISWTLNSQSTANNTSNITFKADLVAGSSGKISSSASKSYTATINGTTYSGTNTVGVSSGATKNLFSKTLTISHDNDGSKSFTFSFSQTFDITFSGSHVGTKSVSCTVNPTAIARASSITSAAAVTLGNAVSIVWTPASSSFACKIKFACGGNTYTTGYITPNRTSAYTYTGYTMAIATWAPYITTATSATCTATLYTYSSSSSSSSIGSSSKTFTVTVPSSVVPSVTINSVTEGGSVTGGQFIQNQSKLKVSFTPTSIYGSSLSSYTVTAGTTTTTGSSMTSGSAKSVTTSTISTAGTVTVTVKVTDARGRSASATYSITVQEYTSPSISVFNAYRTNASGSEETSGEYITVQYTYTCSSVGGINTASMSIKWKGSDETDYNNTLITGTELSASGMVTTTTTFSTDAGYNFQISITDMFTTATRTITVTTAQYPFSVYRTGRGVAFGKAAEEEDMMDVQYDARFLNTVEINREDVSRAEVMLYAKNNGDSGDNYLGVQAFSGYKIWIGVGVGGVNRGIYDRVTDRWLIYADANDDTRLEYPNGNFKPYYAAGDTINIGAVYTAGYITSSGNALRFMIPLCRPILGNPNISISGTVILRQNGSYTHGSSSDSGVSPSSWGAEIISSGVRIAATMSSTTNAVNNAPCGVQTEDVVITLS